MKKHWQSIVIALLLVIIAAIFIFGRELGCNSPSKQAAIADSTSTKVLTKQDSVALLKKQLEDAKNALKNKKNGSGNSHIIVDVNLKDQRQQPSQQQQQQSIVTQKEVPQQQQIIVPQNEDGVKNPVSTDVERTKATINEFCTRLGGFKDRWIPHLAIENNEQFTNLKDNGQNSWNFLLPSTSTLDYPSGIAGQLKDGRYFVSAELIDRYLEDSDNGIVESRASRNYWQFHKMQKVGDYYIDIK